VRAERRRSRPATSAGPAGTRPEGGRAGRAAPPRAAEDPARLRSAPPLWGVRGGRPHPICGPPGRRPPHRPGKLCWSQLRASGDSPSRAPGPARVSGFAGSLSFLSKAPGKPCGLIGRRRSAGLCHSPSAPNGIPRLLVGVRCDLKNKQKFKNVTHLPVWKSGSKPERTSAFGPGNPHCS
jgi:hypothetical protein